MKQASKAILFFGLGFATILTVVVIFISMGQGAGPDAAGGMAIYIRYLATYFVVGLVPFALISAVVEIGSRIKLEK